MGVVFCPSIADHDVHGRAPLRHGLNMQRGRGAMIWKNLWSDGRSGSLAAAIVSIVRICAHRSHVNVAYFLCNWLQSSVLARLSPATRHRGSAFPRRLREKFGCVAVWSHSLAAN